MQYTARTARQHLSADALYKMLRSEFKKVPDLRPEPDISLADSLIAGFAVFALKAPSLLAFEKERQNNEFNLKGIFVPCDTQRRTAASGACGNGSVPCFMTFVCNRCVSSFPPG